MDVPNQGSHGGLHGRGTGAVLRRSVNGTAVRVYGDQRRRGKGDVVQCLDRGIVVGTRGEEIGRASCRERVFLVV